MAYHGCPDTDDPADGVPNPCTGYELTANLDFDTNGNGATHTGGVGDSGDDWYTTTTGTGAGWTPIGGADETTHQAFTGTFEGNDHTISNLYINLDTNAANVATFVGLFADIRGGTARNVGLVNPYVSNTRSGGAAFSRTGALAGRNNAGATVSGSYVSGGSVTSTRNSGSGNNTTLAGCLIGYNAGTVTTSHASCAATASGSYNGRDRAGGLVGQSGGTISDSYATGEVRADNQAGGLVSHTGASASITGSYATGAVFVTANDGLAGGLTGNAGSPVTDSYATGNVTARGSGARIGGLAGWLLSSGEITRSHATGTVIASGDSSRAGGLTGATSAASRRITSSYATGSVSVGGAASIVGGLVGDLGGSGSVGASYATGAVRATGTGNNHLGGLAGQMAGTINISASYATGAVSATGAGNNHLGGLVGRVIGTAAPTITASYSTGAVSATGAGSNTLGGLIASSEPTGTYVQNSYWDSTTNTAATSAGGAVARTSAELQSPSCYTGDYASWNVDVGGDSSADDPWYFGGNTDYPVLRYGDHSLTAQGITSPLAELTGLGIAPGQLHPDFVRCPASYRAVVGPEVAQLTVTHTAAAGVVPTYQDGADNNRPDVDPVAAGLQTPLADGANTIKVTVSPGRSYVLTVHRAVAAPAVAGTTQTLDAWLTRSGRMTTAQLSDSTRAAQTLAFTVGDSNGQSPTADGHWATMQVWLCTTRTVDNTQPAVGDGCVNAGTMSSTGANTATVSATVTVAQAANGGVVVKVWDNTVGSAALQLAQWLPIRLAHDAALRGLEIAAGGTLLPAFAPSTHGYLYYPRAGATAITVTPTVNNPGATVSYSVADAAGAAGHQVPVGGASGAVSAFTVTVTAADGTTQRIYTVTIGTGATPGAGHRPFADAGDGRGH